MTIEQSELREKLVDQIADITDKHFEHFPNSESRFYRINCASEIFEFIKDNIQLFSRIAEKPKMSKEQITKAEELISDTIRKVDKLFGLL